MNSGRIRVLMSRKADAHDSSVASIDPPDIHTLSVAQERRLALPGTATAVLRVNCYIVQMRIEIVNTLSRLVEIGPAWDALWKRGGQSVFQSHGWIVAWCKSKQANDRSRLYVGLGWLGGDLIAAMAFATRWHRGVRVLEWAAKDCSDYCDVLADPAFREGPQALEQVWAAVVASARFDLAYLSHVRPDAKFCSLLDRCQPMELKPGHRSARSLQVRSGGFDGHGWFRSLGREIQDSHARGLHMVEETGPVVVAVFGSKDAADAVLRRMIVLKQQWLVSMGQSSKMLSDNAATLRALIGELDRQQALQVVSVHCGSVLVAALLNIATGTQRQAFFAAHDPKFDHASPEMLVMVECLIRTFDTGISEVDLLCVEDEHEFGFANARIDLTSYVGAKTIVGKCVLVIGDRLDRARG